MQKSIVSDLLLRPFVNLRALRLSLSNHLFGDVSLALHGGLASLASVLVRGVSSICLQVSASVRPVKFEAWCPEGKLDLGIAAPGAFVSNLHVFHVGYNTCRGPTVGLLQHLMEAKGMGIKWGSNRPREVPYKSLKCQARAPSADGQLCSTCCKTCFSCLRAAGIVPQKGEGVVFLRD
jgi:hypothetical protein